MTVRTTAKTSRTHASPQMPSLLRELPPLPQVAVQALKAMRDPRSRRSDIGRLIAMDPALAGRALATANSAYWSLSRRITSVDEAIGYIGFEQTRQLIYAASLQQLMTAALPGYLMEQGVLWRHSFAVAEGARWIAELLRIYPVHDAYMGGLFHDIGKLALNRVVQERARAKQRRLDEQTRQSLIQFERELTGFDHAEIGAAIVQSWQLSDDLVETVRCHHDPGEATEAQAMLSAVHVANIICLNAGIGAEMREFPYIFAEEAMEILMVLGWKEEADHEAVLEHVVTVLDQTEKEIFQR